ncbi:MAG TPA: hypothetical protein VMG59_11150 [Phycisphaerae bacterium]|nr:hypothetical protein [Phycisphaerae bacterium]
MSLNVLVNFPTVKFDEVCGKGAVTPFANAAIMIRAPNAPAIIQTPTNPFGEGCTLGGVNTFKKIEYPKYDMTKSNMKSNPRFDEFDLVDHPVE